jgi:hypothetical protein
MTRRSFGYIRRLPSKRYQASYIGPDLARHAAPDTFPGVGIECLMAVGHPTGRAISISPR